MSFEKICEKRCDQCLFSENRIVSKTRMAQIIRDCRRKDTHFLCHKHTIAGRDVMCRGFYETQPPSQMLRISERLGLVRFVDEHGNVAADQRGGERNVE